MIAILHIIVYSHPVSPPGPLVTPGGIGGTGCVLNPQQIDVHTLFKYSSLTLVAR